MEDKILQGQFEVMEEATTEDFNNTFKKIRVKIFAFGNNANFSNISPNAFELAKNSLKNIPIISKYNPDTVDEFGLEGDLEGHNTKLKKDKNGNWTIFQDTVPLGLVPESAEITFEEVNEGTEDEPNIKTYVVANGCYLWMRYDASKKIEEWLDNDIIPKISMEIFPTAGRVLNNYYCIDAFTFEAITVLGSDKIPCFSRAEIEEYSKKNFKEMYSEMLDELKQFTKEKLDQGGNTNLEFIKKEDLDTDNNINIDNLKDSIENFEQGGNDMDEKLELFKQYTTLQESEVKELKDNVDKYSFEELKNKLDYMLNSQIKTELRNTMRSEKMMDNWGYEYSRFYYVDHDESQSIVYAEDGKDNYNVYRFNYSMNGDNVVVDFESGVKQKIQFADWDQGSIEFSIVPAERFEQIAEKLTEVKSQYEESQEILTKFEELQTKVSTLESEKSDLQSQFETLETKCSEFETKLQELQSFQTDTITNQRNEAENALFEQFSEKLTEEELKPFKETAKDFSLEEIEEKLGAFAYKKIIKFEANKKQKTKINVVFDRNNIPINTGKPYDDILNQYIKKEE